MALNKRGSRPIVVDGKGWRPGPGGLSWPRLVPAALAQWHANGTPQTLPLDDGST